MFSSTVSDDKSDNQVDDLDMNPPEIKWLLYPEDDHLEPEIEQNSQKGETIEGSKRPSPKSILAKRKYTEI